MFKRTRSYWIYHLTEKRVHKQNTLSAKWWNVTCNGTRISAAICSNCCGTGSFATFGFKKYCRMKQIRKKICYLLKYSLHPVLIDIFPYGTMAKITSVLINLLFFIEGDCSFHTPQPTLKTDGPIKLRRGSGMGYCIGETPRWRQYTNQIWISQFW